MSLRVGGRQRAAAANPLRVASRPRPGKVARLPPQSPIASKRRHINALISAHIGMVSTQAPRMR